jgi:hypothetical protein
MLARPQALFVLSFFLALSIAVALPVQAQMNGVPPSVTSIGFGGSGSATLHGVPPSVTSLGPNGYRNNWSGFGNCCTNFFLPSNPNFSEFGNHHHRKDKDRDRDHAGFAVGFAEPVDIPYAVPYDSGTYDSGTEDDGPPDADSNYFGPRNPDLYVKRTGGGGAVENADFDQVEGRVTAQPSTVLIFKDGHQSDVLNYAIVGDTLFDFSANRTRKILLADIDLPATHRANDDRGVDFQIPANTVRP